MIGLMYYRAIRISVKKPTPSGGKNARLKALCFFVKTFVAFVLKNSHPVVILPIHFPPFLLF